MTTINAEAIRRRVDELSQRRRLAMYAVPAAGRFASRAKIAARERALIDLGRVLQHTDMQLDELNSLLATAPSEFDHTETPPTGDLL